MKTLYEILGVEKNASLEQIKFAFKKKAQRLHPDKESGSEEEFKELKMAYDILCDPEKRAQYDATGVIPGVEPSEEQKIKTAADSALRFTFENIITKSGFKGNIIDHAFKTIDNSLNAVIQKRDNLGVAIDKLRKKINRVESKGPTNLYLMAIKEKENEMLREIKDLNFQVDIGKAALKELKNYTDVEPDKESPVLYSFNIQGR